MAKDVINVDGQDVVVREDTAKAYRFSVWGVTVAAIGLALIIILATIFFWRAGVDGKIETPAQLENTNANVVR